MKGRGRGRNVGSQRSDVGGQRSEVRGQRTATGPAAVGGWRTGNFVPLRLEAGRRAEEDTPQTAESGGREGNRWKKPDDGRQMTEGGR